MVLDRCCTISLAVDERSTIAPAVRAWEDGDMHADEPLYGSGGPHGIPILAGWLAPVDMWGEPKDANELFFLGVGCRWPSYLGYMYRWLA